MEKFASILFLILFLGISVQIASGQQESINYTFLVQALQNGVDQLGEKLKGDLNEKYLQLSNQLDDNDRRVGKTLTLFEKEWREKTQRLNRLEDRQFHVETSIIKITNVLNELSSKDNTPKKYSELPDHTPRPVVINAGIPEPTHRPATPENPRVSDPFRPVTYRPRVSEPLNHVTVAYRPRTSEPSNPVTSRPRITEPYKPNPNTPRNEIKQQLIKQTPVDFNTVVVPAVSQPATDVLYLNEIESSYQLAGNKSDFKTLHVIPISDQLDLTSIELHYVHVDPEILIQSLENCTKLRSLKLIQVNLLHDFESWDRVVLPQLQEFVLDQIGILNLRNDTIFSKWTEIDEFLKGVDKGYLKSLIFFDKNAVQTWDINKVSGLGTNINLLIDGVKIFSIDHEAGEISSMLKYSTDFIENLDSQFVLQKLAVSVWRLDLDALPISLRTLNLNYVLANEERGLGKKLEKLGSLEDLNIFIGNQGHLGWRLSVLPPALKNLTIRYSDIRNFPKDRLLRLDNLNLHLCQFDPYFVQDFPQVFEAINISINFRREENSTGLQHFLLQTILQTPVTKILMQNFDRRDRQPISTTVYENMELFLELCGVSGRAEAFVLELIDGEWHGRNMSPAELTWETFHLVGTDKFVTFDAYKRITG